MSDSSENGAINQPFSKSREIIKSHSLQEILGIISLFTVVFTVKSLLGIYLSDLYSWSLTLIPTAFLGFVYNAVLQSRGMNIKNALIIDWVKLKTKTHLIIIGCSVLTLYLSRFFTTALWSKIENKLRPSEIPDLPSNKLLANE